MSDNAQAVAPAAEIYPDPRPNKDATAANRAAVAQLLADVPVDVTPKSPN